MKKALLLISIGLLLTACNLQNAEEPQVEDSSTEETPATPEISSYSSEDLGLSFEYPSNWEVSETNDSIVLQDRSQRLEREETSLCAAEYVGVTFTRLADDYQSENIRDNVPYDENGGLGVFSDELKDSTLAGQNALQGVYGDACGGTDYFVEQAPKQYWLITVPELENSQMAEVEQVLESLSL